MGGFILRTSPFPSRFVFRNAQYRDISTSFTLYDCYNCSLVIATFNISINTIYRSGILLWLLLKVFFFFVFSKFLWPVTQKH